MGKKPPEYRHVSTAVKKNFIDTTFSLLGAYNASTAGIFATPTL